MQRKSSIYLLLLVVVAIALLAYEILVSHGRTYYYTGLGIMLVGFIGFFFHFEGGRPNVILLTMIASLCALGIVSRIAFFFLPQVKPVAAIVILAGIAFGGEVGFVTGAVSAFVSNFYFGQGAWTPFQMFALGMIGALAGILFHGRKSPVWQISCYGFASTLLIYGGIVDINTVFFTSREWEWSVVLGIYATALPFDLIFAASTAIFLWLLKKPLLKRIERVQRKYSLIDKEDEQ